VWRQAAPERRPFRSDVSVSPATMESAKMKSEKYSHGANSRAKAAGGPDQEEAAEDAAPEREAQVPSQPARPDSPLRAIGKPSKVVAMAEGVPGIAGSASRRR
jgi:hypothetical protein